MNHRPPIRLRPAFVVATLALIFAWVPHVQAQSFTTALTYPANGAVNADLSQPITWTSVANVQWYYLYVGTTVGAKDLVDTGGILTTSYLATGLPSGQTVYARIWTQVGGVWRYTDSTFSAAPSIPVTATLTYPANGAIGIDQMQPATWTSVPAVEWYYLYIGSTPGANDLIDSYGTLSTAFPIAFLPAGPTLYARIWTAVDGVWRYSDSTFTASPIAPTFLYPTDGAVGVSAAQPFQWTPPANAQAHELRVGTSPGATDVFDSGEIVATSASVTGLPTTGTLYARVLSKVNGVWRHSDIAFSPESASPVSSIVSPADGEVGFDTVQPFVWQAVPLARGYRLSIGTTPGGDDLHNSGDIHVTRRFVPNLPAGTLFGRLETRINGQWHASEFTFSVGANTVSAAAQIESALWATDIVRSMALSDSLPFSWTELAEEVAARKAFSALCNDYAEVLLRVLTGMNAQLPARRLDTALNAYTQDAHTLVEIFNPETDSWMLLDPTFGLTVRRAADGEWATAEDLSDATRTQQWSAVSYEFLGALGDFYAQNYYLDYPLLFVQIHHVGESWDIDPGASVLAYMEEVPMPVSLPAGWPETFAVGCSGDQTAHLLVDGVESVIDCSGIDGLSGVFLADTIAPTALTTPSVTVYRPRRYVF